jgi:hypothetical protein
MMPVSGLFRISAFPQGGPPSAGQVKTQARFRAKTEQETGANKRLFLFETQIFIKDFP